MDEIASVQMNLMRDRNVLKCRVNIIKGGRIFGFIKPV
jgi:hypothetical protein